jgi:Leucine-rich repeat (LRR) protein
MNKTHRIISAVAVILFFLSVTIDGATSPRELSTSPKNAAMLNHIEDYPELEILSISCLESLKALPDSIGKLTKLKELRIDNGNGCSMNPQLPESIGNLRLLEKLILNGAQDPRGVGDQRGPQPGERHKFPQSMAQLKNLVYLDLGRNGFEEIPPFVKDLPKLKELGFEFNELKQIPPFLSSLRELTTLRLNGNDLRDLPGFLNESPKLTRITLGYNCKITQSAEKMKVLKNRFPKVVFDFEDDYDCPTE